MSNPTTPVNVNAVNTTTTRIVTRNAANTAFEVIETLCKYEAVPLTTREIKLLEPNQLLNDNIIEFYLS